jgi:hypothetical protein
MSEAAGKSLVAMMSDVMAMENALIESGGELTPEMEQEWALTQDNFQDKVDRYYYVIEGLVSRAEYFRSIERQAQAARRVFESQEERLKNNLKYAMVEMTVAELRGHDYRYRLVQTKPKLVIDQDLLPAAYFKEEVTRVPDRALIEQDLELGVRIPGVELVESAHVRPYVNAGTKAKQVKENSIG